MITCTWANLKDSGKRSQAGVGGGSCAGPCKLNVGEGQIMDVASRHLHLKSPNAIGKVNQMVTWFHYRLILLV